MESIKHTSPNKKEIPGWVTLLFALGGIVLLGFLLSQLLDYLFPQGKRPRIFISHSWKEDRDYRILIEKFKLSEFKFYDHSIPSDHPLDENNTFKIEKGIRRKMKWCSKVLVLAGGYADNYWIKKEVQIAKQLGKEVIAVRPWGEQNIPTYLKQDANKIIGFNSKSIIEKIKE